MYEANVHIECGNTLGEGILWDENTSSLYWTDIDEKRLHRWDSKDSSLHSKEMPDKLCSFALRKGGGFLFAFASAFAFGSWDDPSLQWLTQVHDGSSPVRLNDGRCDRQGRFIVGDFDPESKERGSLFRVTEGTEVQTLWEGITCANSICFSPDGKVMYFTDTPKRLIWAFDYDTQKGPPSDKRVFASFEDQPGNPDGSIVDAEGYLWNAQWGGARVVRYSPHGDVDRIVELPAKNITCMCFGGEQLDTLYVTSARTGLSKKELEEYPLSGSVFSIHTDTRGLKESRYAF